MHQEVLKKDLIKFPESKEMESTGREFKEEYPCSFEVKTPNLSLVIFASTKGNFGFRDVYQTALNDMKRRIDLNYFKSRVVHIKDGDEVGSDLRGMLKFYKENGFTTLVTRGTWSHFQPSNHTEYLKDILKVYIDNVGLLGEYSLFMENDFLLRPFRHNLEYWFDFAAEVLQDDKNLFSIRFVKALGEVERINNIKNTHGHLDWLRDREAKKECLMVPGNKFDDESGIRHNEYSNNPNINRTKEFSEVCKIIRQNWNQLSQHSEISIEFAVKYFLKNRTRLPFVSFDPSLVRAIHLGEKNYPELKDLYCGE